MITLMDKQYHGFEDATDIERDLSEMFVSGKASSIPGEFQGTIRVVVTYEPSEEDPK